MDEKRKNVINRQQSKKTSSLKFAHRILIKKAIDIVLPRLNSYDISSNLFCTQYAHNTHNRAGLWEIIDYQTAKNKAFLLR